MKTPWIYGSLFCALALLAPALPVIAQQTYAPDPPFTMEDVRRGLEYAKTSWDIHKQITDPLGAAEPFKILGNLYFVGIGNGEAFLLTSPQGHILLGAGLSDTAEQVAKNIETLGFKLADIKVILLNHHHGDQSGGAAYLKSRTGAQVMAGFAEIPYLEKAVQTPAPPPGARPPPADAVQSSVFAAPPIPPNIDVSRIAVFPAVKVDRALFDGDVVKVGPLSVTAYIVPGHTTSSTSFLYSIHDSGRDYRVFEACCWEFPDDYSRNSAINEASTRHTFATWAKILPVDIYLELGAYGWGGLLNQPSGTFQERLAQAKANPKLWVNRDIFRGLSAAREVSFKENMARLKAAGKALALTLPTGQTGVYQ